MMNRILLLLSLTAFAAVDSYAQTPCIDGMAGEFPCERTDLMAFIPLTEMGSEAGLNDIWGWVDPLDNSEYAIVGQLDGTSFVDMSNPVEPRLVGFLPTHTSPSTWRDIKVYEDYAFIVSEAPGHGMQVFDLARLRNTGPDPVIFDEDAHYDGFGNSHNIAINEESGYAYPIGTGLFNGGPHFIDISTPLEPSLAGSFSDEGYSHDAQIVNYIGPDEDYVGREIYIGFHGNLSEGLVITDVTDKTDPQFISRSGYDCQDYSHQGWITEDHRFCLLNDELDELSFGYNTRTRIFDISDLDNPVLLGNFLFDNASTDHNLYIKDGLGYFSNYSAGLRIVDLTRLDEGIADEVAYFDVHPQSDDVGFGGTWSNYPYFPSGNIPVTHRTTGLFIVQPDDLSGITSATAIDTEVCPAAQSIEERSLTPLHVWPNPTQGLVQVEIPAGLDVDMFIVRDGLGRQVMEYKVQNRGTETLDLSELSSGVYSIEIPNTGYISRISLN